MKASEMIKCLKKVIEEHGDYEIEIAHLKYVTNGMRIYSSEKLLKENIEIFPETKTIWLMEDR